MSVEGERRSLAVEIVDAIYGYTYEFSHSPETHEGDYDRVEEILRRKVGVMTVTVTVLPDADKCTCVVTHNEETNTTTIDPTNCTYSGHMDPAEAFK